MSHKLIDTKSLRVQEGYNDLVRSAKETASNAKDVEKQMAQAGDNPMLFPIKYVKIGKDLFTRNHATLLAAQAREWPKVYAMESPHEAGTLADFLDLITSNNGGHPLSRVAQGKLYKALLDGEPAGEEEIAARPVGETAKMKREPMNLKEIAEAMGGIITQEGIRLNVLLAESSPEIAELLEAGEVSGGVVIDAKKLAKDDDTKALRIVKACIKHAKDDERAKATGKDFDAVKEQFKPITKLVADGKKDADKKKPEDDKDDDDTETLPGGQESGKESQDEGKEDLFAGAPEVLKDGSKKNAKLKAALATWLLNTEGLEKLGITACFINEEADIAAEEIIKIVANAAEVF